MRRQARIAGVFYLSTIVTGTLGALLPDTPFRSAANLAASLCYVVVTVFLYRLFRVVNGTVSLLAAIFSLAGCILGILDTLHQNPAHFNNLVLFGAYCVLLSYLILRSSFMPRWVGIMVAIAGLGWLTFLFPPLAHRIMPAQMLTGLLGEGVLTVFLLIARFKPVDPQAQPAHAISPS